MSGFYADEINRRKYRQIPELHEDVAGLAYLLLGTDCRKDRHCISYGVLRKCPWYTDHKAQLCNAACFARNLVNERARIRSAIWGDIATTEQLEY